MSSESVSLQVTADHEGERLDRFLTDCMIEHSRSALRRLIVDGRVEVDGTAAAKAGIALRSGMRVVVSLPEPGSDRPEPESIPVEIVHEDDQLIVVDKPAGLVVHPGHGNPSGTLINALLGRGATLAPAGGEQRPGIVHRLDRDTSGLLVVAKTDAAHRAISGMFARREVHKTYRAIVWGRPSPASGTIDRGIGRSRANPTRMTVGGRRSRPALTIYQTLEPIPGFALVEVRPVTGRTHQIRVHMRSIHHPVVGDGVYGGPMWRGVQDPVRRKALRSLDRLALHAAELRFVHPATGREVAFSAPFPADLERLLETLRTTG